MVDNKAAAAAAANVSEMIIPYETDNCAALLEACIEINGSSVSAVATACGVTVQAVHQWIDGKTVPNRKNRDTLIRMFRLPAEYITVLERRSNGELRRTQRIMSESGVEVRRDIPIKTLHG